MPDPLHQILVPENWPTFVYVLTRVGGFMSTAPLWSMNAIPKRTRAAVAAMMSVMLLPLAPVVVVPDPMLFIPMALAMEFLVGMVIGLTATVIVQGVAMAGEVVSMQMGLSLGQTVSPLSDVAVPGVGQIKSVLALMIYVGIGGHLMLLEGVAVSLESLPPGMKITSPEGTGLATHLLGTLYTSAIRIAAPTMVALLLTNVAVAITSKVVPQLHAILVLFPINIGVGLIMLGAALPFLAGTMTGWMGDLFQQASFALRAFQPESWGI